MCKHGSGMTTTLHNGRRGNCLPEWNIGHTPSYYKRKSQKWLLTGNSQKSSKKASLASARPGMHDQSLNRRFKVAEALA